MKPLIYFIFLFQFIFNANAQETELVKYKNLASFLASGTANGKSRLYFMSTDNAKPLSDYHGLGFGAGIGYTTPTIKGFSAGMSGYFIMNAYSSDFTIPDSITQNPNRYELGLFDVTDPNNKSDLYRLENLWVQYQNKGFKARYGQFMPNYLFINPQDGRMSPTMSRGLESNLKKGNSSFMLAYIHAFSPRSTVKWYSVSETFGIYPSGRAVDGSAAKYFGNIETSGILLAEWNQKLKTNYSLKVGSMSVLDVFQTWYSNVGFNINGWKLNAMGIFQHSLGDGKNDSYFPQNDHALIFSSQLEKSIKKWQTSLNYTRIADKGRFLMPREWGREPLYTFLPRERNEGLSDVHAATVVVKNTVNKNLSFNAGFGKYWLPDISEPGKNKYAMPSYNQLNLEANYEFSGWLDGAKIKGLVVRKSAMDKNIDNPKVIFNKVDLTTINIICNYNF